MLETKSSYRLGKMNACYTYAQHNPINITKLPINVSLSLAKTVISFSLIVYINMIINNTVFKVEVNGNINFTTTVTKLGTGS